MLDKNKECPIANLIERILRNSLSEFLYFKSSKKDVETDSYLGNGDILSKLKNVLNLYFMYCENYSARLSVIASHLVKSFQVN